MAFENSDPSENAALDPSDAHKEANMLRVELGISPQTGLIREGRIERETSREDYQLALKALEQLHKDVRTESAPFLRGIIRFNQIVKTFGTAGIIAGRALEAVMGRLSGEEESLRSAWNSTREMTDSEWNRVFSDAESRLMRLEASANEFGRDEQLISDNSI